MNNGLLSISATCSNCEEQHTLSQCAGQKVITPPTSWPTSPGSVVINFTCPNCDGVIYTHVIS